MTCLWMTRSVALISFPPLPDGLFQLSLFDCVDEQDGKLASLIEFHHLAETRVQWCLYLNVEVVQVHTNVPAHILRHHVSVIQAARRIPGSLGWDHLTSVAHG